MEVAPAIGGGGKSDPNTINLAINDLGNKIRQLKADKVDKVRTGSHD